MAPHTPIEQTLTRIWQDLIGIEPIGTYDNFFELGGDSLLAVGILSRVREAFGINLLMADLVGQPTIAFLAKHIETTSWAAQDSQAGPLTPGPEREEIEL
jgi:acyl carrier protein